MYHTVSVRFASGTLLRGGSLAILDHYDAASALEVLRRLRPTTAFMVPTHLHRLLGLADLGPDERFDSLRLLAHAGAACPPALKRAAMARVGEGVLWEFYGSTEGQFTACSPAEWLERPGTVGRARPGRRLEIATLQADPVPVPPPTRLPSRLPSPTPAGRDRCPGPSGATPRPSPASRTGATRRPPRRPGGATPSPWATWATSTPTATSTSRAGATT